jgi:predicted RNA binding protein YcfA (HicA-like mRNA interferase family)
MPRLPALRPRQVIAALQRAGFTVVRQRGSHVQLKRGNLLVTVPVHSGDLRAEVFRSILRQAKMEYSELARYL